MPITIDLFSQLDAEHLSRTTQHMTHTLVSLFAGAGGLDLGFEQSGFKTIWANEYDKTIAPSYQNYFKHVKFDGRSIVDIPSAEIPKAIGVIGGPPCQSWSEAGAKRGFEDPRGQLFEEYIRVIQAIKPIFFLAENVHGLIHARNLKSFENIIERFEKMDYLVTWKLLKASDYGVPQDRERVFIVGYHKSLGKKFTFPEPQHQRISLKDAIFDLSKIKLGTKKIKNHEISDTGYSSMFMSRNRVRNWSEASFTILATDRHIPLHPQAPKMIKHPKEDKFYFAPGHEDKYRRFSIRECARIQTFPDDYEFLYKIPRNGYKMIGNAVPVTLAKHVATAIFNDLKEIHGHSSN